MNKKVVLVTCAGIAILVLRIYASDNNKTPNTALPVSNKSVSEPALSSTPPSPSMTSPIINPAQQPAATPVGNNHTPVTNSIPAAPAVSNIVTTAKPPVAPSASVAPAAANIPPTMNFQMQMAQLHQKVFSGFEQADLLEFGQALDQALNGALASREFDQGINKLEDAVKDLAVAFGKNIEVDGALNAKVKQAFNTAVTEFDALNRSGKISNLTGEAYLARILKSALAGLKIGFAKAPIIPENTPVPANLDLNDQVESHSESAAKPAPVNSNSSNMSINAASSLTSVPNVTKVSAVSDNSTIKTSSAAALPAKS